MARAKQETLPGVPKGIPELEKIGLEYAEARDRRMEILKEEVNLKAKAMESMQKHGLLDYKVEGIHMQIVAGEAKLKVTVEKDADGDGGAE